jgi:hypothetical protein
MDVIFMQALKDRIYNDFLHNNYNYRVIKQTFLKKHFY